MPDDGPSEGTVTRIELEELAQLFDRFEFAFDPLAREAKEAESEFEDRIRGLFETRVVPAHPHVSFALFHCRIKSWCRSHLRRNPA